MSDSGVSIPEQVLSTLAASCAAGGMSDEEWRACVERVVVELTGGGSEPESSASDPVQPRAMPVYSALMLFCVLCAKHAVTASQLASMLESAGVPSHRAALLMPHFSHAVSENEGQSAESAPTAVQASVAAVGMAGPSLVDVHWRLDYLLKDNRLEFIDQPHVLVDLELCKPSDTCRANCDSDANSPQHTRFLCTPEQLQSLLYRLKEAYKAFQGVASSNAAAKK